jgi:hypothetical protein
MIYEKVLNIYTDGSSLSAPRRGGMGVRFVTLNDAGDEVSEDIEEPGHGGATYIRVGQGIFDRRSYEGRSTMLQQDDTE